MRPAFVSVFKDKLNNYAANYHLIAPDDKPGLVQWLLQASFMVLAFSIVIKCSQHSPASTHWLIAGMICSVALFLAMQVLYPWMDKVTDWLNSLVDNTQSKPLVFIQAVFGSACCLAMLIPTMAMPGALVVVLSHLAPSLVHSPVSWGTAFGSGWMVFWLEQLLSRDTGISFFVPWHRETGRSKTVSDKEPPIGNS